jgi:pyruvate dehydrogenase E1 component alpha subunit
MGAHTTTDDPTRYRLSAELEAWKLKDPIERVKQYLIRTEQAEMSFFDEVEAEATAVGLRIRASCQQMPDPAPESMFDDVLTSETPQLAAQRAEFAAYLDSFADAEPALAEEGR